MPGLSLDGKKKKEPKRNKREKREKKVPAPVVEEIPEEPIEEEEPLGTYSVLDSIEIDISDAEDDWYLAWVHDNFDDKMQPMIDTLPKSDTNAIEGAIKNAIIAYNSGNVVDGDINSKIIPQDMEVDIY